MISFFEQRSFLKEGDDGGELQRCTFPPRGNSHGSPVVSGVSAKHAPRRRTHGRTGVKVDHSTINRWVVKYSPQLEQEFHRRKRPVWVSWRMDETYIKVKGEWK